MLRGERSAGHVARFPTPHASFAELVAPGDFLLAASCSHNVTPENFLEETARGLADAGRTGRIVRAAGAAGDHPLHPHLPESAYLKALLIALD